MTNMGQTEVLLLTSTNIFASNCSVVVNTVLFKCLGLKLQDILLVGVVAEMPTNRHAILSLSVA